MTIPHGFCKATKAAFALELARETADITATATLSSTLQEERQS
jgi:hypothetical protein